MSPTVNIYEHRMARLDEIEADLENWEHRIQEWAKRIPWTTPDQKEIAMSTAKFLRKLVAECWIHTLAAKSRGADPMDTAAFRARRLHRQLLTFGPALAVKMEGRLPEAIPSLAA